ncbi:MAG: SRPBCC family protein, partial [Actinomycetota bacterium]|nr:SRPBCC family protein [Actinomycetota bacterium]
MSPLAPQVVVGAATEVARPADEVWTALTDWESQGEWMPLTRVRSDGGAGEGEVIEAFTGVGALGLRDPMVIASWDPPRCCTVEHVGPVLKGWGSFEVHAIGPARCRVVWSEGIRLPLRRLGPLGRAAIRA